MAATFEAILSDVKQKNYAPVYFLHGEEPYFMDVLAKELEQSILTPSQRAFNQIVCYGNEIDFKAVLSSCRQLPVMANNRVVIVKEAQNIRMKEFELLIPYIKKPSPKTILVFVHKHKKIDGRSILSKELIKNGAVVFKSDKIRDYKLQQWITQRYSKSGHPIETKATALLAEYLGNDLSKIVGEVKKLCDQLDDGEKITADLVHKKIGISKDYNVFELQNAIIKNSKKKAFEITKYFGENPKAHPVIPIIALLFSFFSKVIIAQHFYRLNDKELMPKLGVNNSYFLKDYRAVAQRIPRERLYKIFEALKKADMRSKGIGGRSLAPNLILFDLMQQIFQTN